jgi:tryptophan synthase alpha chain
MQAAQAAVEIDMAASKLTSRIRQANEAGRKGLIAYLPAGFPSLEEFFDVLKELSTAGADIIEIGVPFSDPVADGPVVEQAALECIERGVTLEWILRELPKHRADIDAAVLLMGYTNPFYQYGYDRLAADVSAAGVDGFIVPDLPFEEAGDLLHALKDTDAELVPLIGLNTSAERMALYTKGFGGFCYVVSVLGVTGGQVDVQALVGEKLAEAKACFDIPVALGFGIKEPSQLADVGGHLDAVVFGSALITHLREGGTASEFMAAWTA